MNSYRFFLLVVLVLVFRISIKPVFAETITQDPQFVVINISDFYFADWDANEASWSAEVKPQLVNTIREIRDTVGSGTENRKLAWSTLLEYTDFPLDQPNENSRYVIQARRILELAEETDIPVFIPLNGYQWWNEVPELWNWWDPDGDQTEGCENDRYTTDSCRMPKLKDPAFRKRFIEGYNPDNKWNVEWQDWQTPMKLNWRNWGSGGFQLAPPPNLVDHSHTNNTYKDFQTARFEAITRVIAKKYKQWLQDNKDYLFAGITIGTEVSLNASVKKEDEFEPYGYRAMQDIMCPVEFPTCGQTENPGETRPDESSLRQKIVNDYLTDLSFRAFNNGLPKQRIYTHVWSEVKENDPRYENYFAASLNYYARPTLSLYGYAQDPLSLPLLKGTLEKESWPVWGAGEFSTDKDRTSWKKAMANTLENATSSAKIIDIYNWAEHKDTEAIPEIKNILQKDVTQLPKVSEILPLQRGTLVNSSELKWNVLNEDEANTQKIYIFKTKKRLLTQADPPLESFELPPTTRAWDKSQLKPGFYQWYVERSLTTDHGQTIKSRSAPERMYIPIPTPEDKTPWWIKQILRFI